MINAKKLAGYFLIFSGSLNSLAFASNDTELINVESSVQIFKETQVGNNSLMVSSENHQPIFRVETAIVPRGWSVKYLGDMYATKNISWNQNDKWTQVLDRFARTNNINVIADGAMKTVLVGPTTSIRKTGLILASSLSPSTESQYKISEAYAMVQQANYDRLMRNAQKEKIQKLEELRKSQEEFEIKNGIATKKKNSKATESVVSELEDSTQQTANMTNPKPKLYALSMKPGFLKEQVEVFIAGIQHVDSLNRVGTAMTVWEADENLKWPNHFVITGESELHILNSIVKSYSLYARIKKNNVVKITTGR